MTKYADLSVPTSPRAGNYRSPEFRAVIAQLPTGDCVIWPGTKDKYGYGICHYNGHPTVAHRAVWTEINGRIPDGKVLDHFVCHNTSCVNPTHMDPTTQRVNVVVRGWDVAEGSPTRNAKKTHCVRGHEFTPENTHLYVKSATETQRVCKACWTIKNRSRPRKRKSPDETA